MEEKISNIDKLLSSICDESRRKWGSPKYKSYLYGNLVLMEVDENNGQCIFKGGIRYSRYYRCYVRSEGIKNIVYNIGKDYEKILSILEEIKVGIKKEEGYRRFCELVVDFDKG